MPRQSKAKIVINASIKEYVNYGFLNNWPEERLARTKNTGNVVYGVRRRKEDPPSVVSMATGKVEPQVGKTIYYET